MKSKPIRKKQKMKPNNAEKKSQKIKEQERDSEREKRGGRKNTEEKERETLKIKHTCFFSRGKTKTKPPPQKKRGFGPK